MTRSEMLAAVVDHRRRLQPATPVPAAVPLLAQLDALEVRLLDGEVPVEAWEQFELHFTAYKADLRRALVRQCALNMLAFEDLEEADPLRFANDDEVKKMLYWWRAEGGKEQFLSSITLEERRELEKKAQEWRQKREGGAPPAPPAG